MNPSTKQIYKIAIESVVERSSRYTHPDHDRGIQLAGGAEKKKTKINLTTPYSHTAPQVFDGRRLRLPTYPGKQTMFKQEICFLSKNNKKNSK